MVLSKKNETHTMKESDAHRDFSPQYQEYREVATEGRTDRPSKASGKLDGGDERYKSPKDTHGRVYSSRFRNVDAVRPIEDNYSEVFSLSSPHTLRTGVADESMTDYRTNRPLRGGRFSGKGPKGYTRSKERIVEDVCEELERNGDVDATDIEVECHDVSVVRLKGEVPNRVIKRIAEDCAYSVRGVKDVDNRIAVNESVWEKWFGR